MKKGPPRWRPESKDDSELRTSIEEQFDRFCAVPRKSRPTGNVEGNANRLSRTRSKGADHPLEGPHTRKRTGARCIDVDDARGIHSEASCDRNHLLRDSPRSNVPELRGRFNFNGAALGVRRRAGYSSRRSTCGGGTERKCVVLGVHKHLRECERPREHRGCSRGVAFRWLPPVLGECCGAQTSRQNT